MEEHSATDFWDWIAFNELELNEQTKQDHYLAQICVWLKFIADMWGKDGAKLEAVDKFFIKFKTNIGEVAPQAIQRKRPKKVRKPKFRPPTKFDKKSSNVSQSIWMGWAGLNPDGTKLENSDKLRRSEKHG